jgi:hypothetical protein
MVYEETVLLDILKEKTLARQLIPHTTIEMKDLKAKYWQKVEDHRARVGIVGDPSGVPTSMNATQLAEEDLPYIATKMHFGRLELERMDVDVLPVDDRINMVGESFSEWEDDVFWLGTDSNGVATPAGGVTTTGNFFAANNVFNATTAALAVTSTAKILDELEYGTGIANNNGMKDLSKYPIVMIMNSNVWYQLFGLTSTATGVNAVMDIDRMIKAVGAPGSGLVRHNWLGGSVSYDSSGKRTFTPGTSNVAVMAIDKLNFEVYASPFSQIPKFDAHEGVDLLLEERYAPVFKRQEAIIFEDDVTMS